MTSLLQGNWGGLKDELVYCQGKPGMDELFQNTRSEDRSKQDNQLKDEPQ